MKFKLSTAVEETSVGKKPKKLKPILVLLKRVDIANSYNDTVTNYIFKLLQEGLIITNKDNSTFLSSCLKHGITYEYTEYTKEMYKEDKKNCNKFSSSKYVRAIILNPINN